MAIAIIQFLREKGLEYLISEYQVNINRHKRYSNLICINYDQIKSPINDITNQCRALIVDEANDWNIVARGFDRFFNHDEGRAARIDWRTARVLEKIDGSYTALYWYNDAWELQSKGTPDGSGEVQGFGFTFRELFWEVWNKLGYQLPENKDFTYIFELCSIYNKVVCYHPKSRIVSLGMRSVNAYNNYEQQLSNPHLGEKFGWEIVKTHPMASFLEIVKVCELIDPIEGEGFVVVDNDFNRVKIKSESYKALNNLRDGHGPKRIVQMICSGKHKQFLKFFPEWVDQYTRFEAKFNSLVSQIQRAWEDNRHIQVQKDFALTIKDIPFSGALFMMRAGKVNSVREYLARINVNNIVEYLEKQ